MKLLLRLLLVLIVLCLFSCNKDDDDAKVSDNVTEYTIMMYGTDTSWQTEKMIESLNQIEGYGKTNKINFTAKIKFSKDMQIKSPELYGGTRLFSLKDEGLVNERTADVNFRLDNPDNIADFIKYAKEKYPAKHYILILACPINGISTGDDPDEITNPNNYSRSIGFDNNTMSSISIFELEEGIKRANMKFDMIYGSFGEFFDFESLYQIKDYTKYFLGSAASELFMTSYYSKFFSALENNPNLVDAMKSYIHEAYSLSKFVMKNNMPRDLSLINAESLEEVANLFKEYSDELCDYRSKLTEGSQEDLYYNFVNSTPIDRFDGDCFSKGGALYFYQSSFPDIVDFSSFIDFMSYSLPDFKLKAIASDINEKMKNVFLASESETGDEFVRKISFGLMWQKNDSFNSEYNGKSIKDVYKKTKFDQVTNWSNFLEKNTWKKVKLLYIYPFKPIVFEADSKFNTWNISIDYEERGGLSKEEFENKLNESAKYLLEAYKNDFLNISLPEGKEQYMLSQLIDKYEELLKRKLKDLNPSTDIRIKFELKSETAQTITKELVINPN